jgi:hypothetical protein
MASHTQAASNSSADNELHHDDRQNVHDDRQNVHDYPAYQERRMAATAAATLRRLNNNTRLTISPRSLDSPFNTPSPGSSKRSHGSIEDGSTPIAGRAHQRARHDRAPTFSPLPENENMHQRRQIVALPPVVQEQEPEEPAAAAAARPAEHLPSFGDFLQHTGLARELRPQLPFPVQGQYRLRRTEHPAARPPPPPDREHRRLPSPNPGAELFEDLAPPVLQPHWQYPPPRPPPPPQGLERRRLPTPALVGQPGVHPQLPVAFPPAPAPAPAPGYYHRPYDKVQPPPPRRHRWLLWDDTPAVHREAWIANEKWEDDFHELLHRMNGLIARAILRTFEHA